MTWTPVKLPEPNAPRTRWTNDALTCLELNAVCSLCPIHRAFGLKKNLAAHTVQSECRMPFAVQTLLNNKVPLTKVGKEGYSTERA